jgi:hypothetical protein
MMTRCKRWSVLVIGFGVAALFATRGYADPIEEKYQKSVDKGLEWLKKTQLKDGSWSNGGQNPVAMTPMAGLALLCEGSTVTQGKYRDQIRLAADYLMRKSQKAANRDGLIGDPSLPGETGRYMYGHGFSMLFLACCYGEEEDMQRRQDLKDILTRAVKYCGSAQSTQGGWYYTSRVDGNHDSDEGSVTVTQMQALRACRDAGIPVPKEIMKKGADYLRKSTAGDGGVVYSLGRGAGMPAGGGKPALTAAAIACLFSAGDYKDEHIKKWFKFCYDPNKRDNEQRIPLGGGGARFGFDEYTHFYYAASIYFLGEDGYEKLFPGTPKDKCLTWSRYRHSFFDGIVKTQQADGGFPGLGGWGSGPIYATSVYCIMMQLDNNCLPVFQR